MRNTFAVALLLISFGVMWCIWLYTLHPSKQSYQEHPNKTCNQIYPYLRTILLVFAVLLVLSTLYYAGKLLCEYSSMDLKTLVCRGLMILVLLLLFLVQIRYITRIKHERRLVQENCSKHNSGLYYTVLSFGILQVLVGFGLVGGII